MARMALSALRPTTDARATGDFSTSEPDITATVLHRQVARHALGSDPAQKAGKLVVPHSSHLSLVTLFSLYFMDAIGNAGPFVEFTIELFFNERNGPLLNALGASHTQSIASSRVTCFCQHHQRAAKEHGVDHERARQGYQKLDQFIQAALKGQRPSDGYFVEFWRLLVEWPEIIAWDRLFDATKHQVLAEVNAAVKRVRPGLQVGFHLEHVNSFNPIFRATRSYADLATKADFLKVVVYDNCGGERYANFIRNVGSTVFRDVPKEELLRFNNHLLNYGDEAELEELATAGLSPDYIFRETQRALAGVAGRCRILPGIDIDIPTGKAARKALPEDTHAAVTAAVKAGAQGVILSRKYSEMRLANLEAAGRAARG